MKKLLLLLFLIILSIFFFRKSVNEFPSHIHAWSQSDRYALALGFVNNGLDFFHPQTYNLNFPSKTPLPVEEGITAVDFPVHEYMVAIIMKIFGTRAPWPFRLYNLLYSFIGLYFLYKLSRLFIDDNEVLNFIIIGFVFTAPVYTYYMDGFIPSVTSVANTFIAYYFFFKYKKENNIKDFYWSVFFVTLAALGRMPFAIFLVAIFGQQVLYYLKQGKISWKEITAVVTGGLFIAGYFGYNAYLRKVYGSIFLAAFLPSDNLGEFKEVLKIAYQRWFFQYFTASHYIFLLIIIAAGIYSVMKSKVINGLQKQFALQILIAGAGALAYFILMSHQYREHDYYFLDSFFPVVILLLIGFTSLVKNFKINKYAGITVLILSVSFFAWQSMAVQIKREDTGAWDRQMATIHNFTGSGDFLARNNVAPDARIMVIDAYTPNIPFILMNRKGYAIMNTSRIEILKALKYRFNYIIIQDQFLLSDVLNNCPQLKNYLSRIDGNGKITLYSYHPIEKETSLIEFLGLDKTQAHIDAQINFDDTLKSEYWMNADKRADKMLCDFDYGNTGNFTAYADSATEYGTTFNLPASKLDVTKGHNILFEGYFCSSDDLRDVLITGYAGHADVVNYQQYFDLSTQVKEKGKWSMVQFLFNINKLDASDEIKVFLWNPKRKFVCYDNLRVRVY